MLQAIRNLFAPSVGARVIVRGAVIEQGYHLAVQKVVRATGVKGVMQVFASSRYLVLDLEGARPRLEWLVEAIHQKANPQHITGLEVNWKPYVGNFPEFRVRL